MTFILHCLFSILDFHIYLTFMFHYLLWILDFHIPLPSFNTRIYCCLEVSSDDCYIQQHSRLTDRIYDCNVIFVAGWFAKIRCDVALSVVDVARGDTRIQTSGAGPVLWPGLGVLLGWTQQSSMLHHQYWFVRLQWWFWTVRPFYYQFITRKYDKSNPANWRAKSEGRDWVLRLQIPLYRCLTRRWFWFDAFLINLDNIFVFFGNGVITTWCIIVR